MSWVIALAELVYLFALVLGAIGAFRLLREALNKDRRR
jgi:hypothetical protein